MENLPALIRLGLGFLAVGIVGGGLGYSSYRLRDNRVDQDDPDVSRLDKALSERTDTADAARYLLYLIPLGVLLLVVGGLVELFS